MSPQMDMDGNHRMDWFFDRMCMARSCRAYHFEGQATQNGDVTNMAFQG